MDAKHCQQVSCSLCLSAALGFLAVNIKLRLSQLLIMITHSTGGGGGGGGSLVTKL